MRVLLVNPPNCGRSIPEERFGIDSIKLIFRGEPFCLETLAGNLPEHDLRILDLKVEDAESIEEAVADFAPDIVGLTAMTCEAQTVVALARRVRQERPATQVAVGGVHASNDPEFFNRPEFDFIAVGLGKGSFRALVEALERGDATDAIPGIARANPGARLALVPRRFGPDDLAEENPPRYDLVERHRDHYSLRLLGLNMGFVASAFGCTHDCTFCSVGALTGNRYLAHSPEAIVRDIGLLGDTPVIRLVDANTFGDPRQARRLAEAIAEAGIQKRFLIDARSDTVVRHPELFRQWKEIGLQAVVIGFEEIRDDRLSALGKGNSVDRNRQAIEILHEIGVSIVGDFIVSPDYREEDFAALRQYVRRAEIGLPICTILTPLPGTALYGKMEKEIVIDDLDYYTLMNAVTPTRLPEAVFYSQFAEMLREFHEKAAL